MKFRVLLILGALVLFSGTPALAEGIDLSGVWQGNDGGTYYLRHLGNELWWYGESSPTEAEWANVAFGTVEKNELHLKWADVPKGRVHNQGTLVIGIVSEGKMELKTETGGFAGSEWLRVKPE